MNFEKSYGVKDPVKLAKWIEHPDGGEFFIAPLNNSKQIEENLKLLTPEQLAEGVSTESMYETKVKSCEIMSKSVLLDWKQVEDNSGETVDYTEDRGMEALYQFDEFREWVMDQAKAIRDELDQKEDAIAKN
jgi:hypothetical protein